MKFKEYKVLGLAATAADVLKELDENDTFHNSSSTLEGHPAVAFYAAPPATNRIPCIHHVMARTIKGVVCRSNTRVL